MAAVNAGRFSGEKLPGGEAACLAKPVIDFPQSSPRPDNQFKEVGIKCPKGPLKKRNAIIAKT